LLYRGLPHPVPNGFGVKIFPSKFKPKIFEISLLPLP
jgi:hypothetical protein